MSLKALHTRIGRLPAPTNPADCPAGPDVAVYLPAKDPPPAGPSYPGDRPGSSAGRRCGRCGGHHLRVFIYQPAGAAS